MIHTARQSGKFIKLVRALRVLLPDLPVDVETVAVGILERLWHVTIASTPRGDIGRLSDEIIAESVGWFGEPKLLIETLCDANWLDRDVQHRLLVHGWEDHAPGYVKKNIARKGGFVSQNAAQVGSSEEGCDTKLAQLSQNARTPNQTKPNQTKPPPPTPSENAGTASTRSWGGVGGDLLAKGVKQAQAAIDSAQRFGCSIAQVDACIAHHAAHPEWGPGVLYNRLVNLRPDQDPLHPNLWPNPGPAPPQTPAEHRAEVERQQQALKAERERIEAEQAASEQRYQQLEARHGDVLDALDQQGIIELIKQAQPDGPEFLIRRYRQQGLTATLRLTLLDALEAECQSTVIEENAL
ncbi:MAG: hypothetical protein KDA57_22190 [Planctomycetales bacterium]|nr:hypothetical protein [Planctomycetales bacterium]